MKQCVVWLYRGAWQEWEPHQIEMAVPLSPQELLRKRTAIFKHESQKDKALYPGSDPREFWQRAEDRNRGCAELYDATRPVRVRRHRRLRPLEGRTRRRRLTRTC